MGVWKAGFQVVGAAQPVRARGVMQLCKVLMADGIIAPRLGGWDMQHEIDRFLEYLEQERGRSGHTLSAYRLDLKQFLSFLDHTARPATSSADLTREDFQAYVQWLRSRDYKPATITRKWATVRSFLAFSLRRGEGVDKGNYEDIHPTMMRRRQPRILDAGEVARLLQAPAKESGAIALRDRAILAMLYHLGLRASEVIHLRLEHVDLASGALRGFRQREAAMALEGSAEPLRQYLEEGRPHLARKPEVREVFLNLRGTGLSRQGVWLLVKRWAKVAGLGAEVSPHVLRHSLAAHMIARGEKLKTIQQRLDLRSPNSVRVFYGAKGKAGRW
jgi:integrase/recombinase XerD